MKTQLSKDNWFYNDVLRSLKLRDYKYQAKNDIQLSHSSASKVVTKALNEGDYTTENYIRFMQKITEDLEQAIAYVDVNWECKEEAND